MAWWHPISIPVSNSLLDYFQSKPVDCEINLFCAHHPLATTIPFAPLPFVLVNRCFIKIHDINIRSRQNISSEHSSSVQNQTDGGGNYQEWATIIFICLSPPDIKGFDGYWYHNNMFHNRRTIIQIQYLSAYLRTGYIAWWQWMRTYSFILIEWKVMSLFLQEFNCNRISR